MYCKIIVEKVLPALKGVLLISAGVVPTRSNEKPRVTRIAESASLTKLVTLLQDMLTSRFDSLIVMSDFASIWSMVAVWAWREQ